MKKNKNKKIKEQKHKKQQIDKQTEVVNERRPANSMIKRTDNELGKPRQTINCLATYRSKGSMNKGYSVVYIISIWSCVEI
jgi:hypothetical protein